MSVLKKMTTLSFKDTLIISLGVLSIYLASPLFREYLETFKKDVKNFDNGIPELENDDYSNETTIYGPFLESHYLKDKEESDFSDISNTYIEDNDRFRKLFKELI